LSKSGTNQYFFIVFSGVIPPDKVKKARAVVTDYMVQEGMIKSEADLRICEGKPGKLLSGYYPITNHSDFL